MSQQTSAPIRPRGTRFHYAYVILLLGLLTILGAQGFTRFGYSMLLPGMSDALQLNYAQTGLLATANFAGYAIFASMVGLVVARLGFRVTIAVGTLTTGTAMILTGTAQSFELALGLQLLAGLSAGLTIPSVMTLITAWFASRWRGKAAGIMSAGGPLGSVITGPIIPMFIIAFGAMGWRYGWFALGAAVVIFGLLNLFLLRDNPQDAGCTPFGESTPQPASTTQEARKVHLGSVYRSRLVWHLAIIGVISALGAISFNTFFATYLINERGLTTSTAGQLWALCGLVGVVGGFVWGGVSDRLGRRSVFIATSALQAICFALFALDASILIFGLCAVLYGITARGAFTVSAAYCGDYFGDRESAAAYGLISLGGLLVLGRSGLPRHGDRPLAARSPEIPCRDRSASGGGLRSDHIAELIRLRISAVFVTLPSAISFF